MWETHTVEGRNPKTGEVATAERRRLRVIDDLPLRAKYDAFVLGLLGSGTLAAARPGQDAASSGGA